MFHNLLMILLSLIFFTAAYLYYGGIFNAEPLLLFRSSPPSIWAATLDKYQKETRIDSLTGFDLNIRKKLYYFDTDPAEDYGPSLLKPISLSTDIGNETCSWSHGYTHTGKGFGIILCDINNEIAMEHLQERISWLKQGEVIISRSVIVSSTTEFTTGNIRYVRGLNYILDVTFGNSSFMPILARSSSVTLQVSIPADTRTFKTLSYSAASMRLIVKSDGFDFTRFQPFRSYKLSEESENHVHLLARSLNSKTFTLPTSPSNGGNGGDMQISHSSGCPIQFIEVNGYCWQRGMKPQVAVFDKSMQSFYDAHTSAELKSDTASVTLFKTTGTMTSNNQVVPLSYANIYLKQNGNSSLNIQVGRSQKAVLLPKQILRLRTFSGGTMDVDFPPLLDTDVLFRTDFMAPGLWKPLHLKDTVKRIIAMKEETLQKLMPANSKLSASAMSQTLNRILTPSLNGIPTVSPSNLQKRSVSSVPDGYVHEDHHENFQHLMKRQHGYPKSWSLDVSDAENMEYHEESKLVKRNFFTDKIETIVDKVRDFKNEVQDDLYGAASAADSYLVEKSDGNGVMSLIVKCIQKTAKKIITVVIKTVTDAVQFVKGIFNRINISLMSLYGSIRAVFSFDDIKNTGRFLAHHMQNMVNNIDVVLDQRESDFDASIEQTKQNIDAKFNNMLARFGDKSFEEIGNLGGKQPQDSDTSSSADQSDPQHSYITNSILGTVSPEKPDPSQLAPGLRFNTTKIREDFVNQVNGIIDPAKQEEFVTQFRSQMNVFEGGFLSLTMVKLITFLKNTFDLAISCVKSVKSMLTKYLKTIFQAFNRILSYRFNLPFITKFFEKVIMKGSAQLTLFNLFALMGAVPATAVYKELYNRVPLSTEVVDVLVKTINMNDYIKNIVVELNYNDAMVQEIATAMSHCIGFVYTTTTAFYAATSFMNQLTMWPFRKLQGYVLGLLQFVIQITSLPFNWELDYNSPSFAIRNEVWSYSLMSFILHKGNPTLPALFIPSFLNALFQTILAVPKLSLLVLSLEADLSSIDNGNTTKVDSRAQEALTRYFGYTAYTLAQFLEWFTLASNPGASLFPLNNFYFNPVEYAWFFIFPPALVSTVAFSIGQNVLLWISSALHFSRLMLGITTQTPFLN